MIRVVKSALSLAPHQAAALALLLVFLAAHLGAPPLTSADGAALGSQTRIRSAGMGPTSGSCGSTILAYATLEHKAANPDHWEPLEGKTVGFTLGSSTASGVTDANGVATASLLVAQFAGDSTYNPDTASTAFTYAGLCGLSPASQCFTYEGGGGSVSVLAAGDHAWSAASGADWITITSGGSGAGSVAFEHHLDAARRGDHG